MDTIDRQTLDCYTAHAGSMAARYRTVEGGVSEFFAEAFKGFPKILDVGCGAGRDLVRLLMAGHDAIGADVCRAMLDRASPAVREAGFEASERLVLDSLPDLASFDDNAFDGLLCSATLMHLPEERLFDSIYGMRRVLRQGGRLLLSVPAQRPDVDPETRRDRDGRYFADLPPAKLKLLLERTGFQLLREAASEDALGRPGYSWATFLFERRKENEDRPLDQVESILNRDRKDATYKLALFRALADLAQTQYNIACFDLPGRVGIPIEALAERWLVYYWPVVESGVFIPQKYGEAPGSAKPVAIRAPLRKLMSAFATGGGLPAFKVALKNNILPDDVRQAYRAAIGKIGRTIWNMPVRYAGGGEDFSVFGYDRTTRRVTMPESLWRELTLTGSWILDATVLRWAELTERLSKGAVTAGAMVERLLAISDADRETRDARQLFARIGVTECVWSNRPIRNARFDVDHVIPFVLWHNNDLWNLLPAHPAVNNEKRDRLPTHGLLRQRRGHVIGYWEALRGEYEERFDREAAAFCGTARLRRNDWQPTLFSRLAEAVEITAAQRRVPRWEPEAPATAAKSGPVSAARPYRTTTARTVPHADEPTARERRVFDFEDVGDQAFRRYLPMIGALAAGSPSFGFDIADLEQEAQGAPWLAVPERLCGKNRFVVRIAGDSMEPELSIGDYVVFEYHRTPRAPNQIVIANIAELGIASDLSTVHAVKWLIQTPEHWVFRSVNPDYDDIRVPKAECAYPILGVMTGHLA